MVTVTPEPTVPTPPNGGNDLGHGFSIAALIVGIFAIIFCWVPAFGLLLGGTALVLGVAGYRRAHNGQAITGIVLGVIGGVVGLIITGLTIVAATHVVKHPDDTGNIISQWDGETQRMPLPGQPGDTQLPTIKAIDKFLAGVDGTYLVGRDIPAGTYSSPGPKAGAYPLCYWERLSNASGEAGSTIANDLTQGSSTVAVAKTDYALKVAGCNGWTKQ